ncbi:alpha 1,2-mannosyltransferase 2.4.1 [Hanseniaspora osmophila]|uniref:Glycolipid 2-alpha-mannosyltransferase n=1 Tax=Hanseniaspora osmophila TaxID=56408 RepID=A0A1E5R7W0_9ASCO|nr:Glycolipid 2-alpha-mannosyltransferase [Hanseniaspora osmophila]
MAVIVSKKIVRIVLVALVLITGLLYSTRHISSDLNSEQLMQKLNENKDYLANSVGLKTSSNDTEEDEDDEDAVKKPFNVDKMFKPPGTPVKACFVSLVRNSDVWSLMPSIRSVEDRFNKNHGYTWVFLNNEPFDTTFKKAVSNIVSGEVKFGLIPEEHWSYPDWIDQDKAAQTRQDMSDIIYGDSESYRHMCRFESGFFWRNQLLDEFDWYWRVEPDTKLSCDIPEDPFQYMNDNKKIYGFTISIHEYESTIPSLWSVTKDFVSKNPEYVNEDNMLDFISNDDGDTYNLCHFWSNFEVANLNFWRSEQYKSYFEFLDQSGGFFYERWGDAPVHSIAVALFLPKTSVKFFDTISYFHPPYIACPRDINVWQQYNCDCNPEDDFTFEDYSCGKEYYKANNMKKPKTWRKGNIFG